MNALIVDDEIYVVRALQKNIDWKSLGIEHALIAFNAAKAREIFEKEEIQILVTDIEMPGESGLDLAEWAAEKYPDCKTIFLTSHAEFTYAQRAMRCNAMDYVLKPMDFASFSSLIGRAVSRIRKEQAKQEREKHGEQWEDMSSELRQSFWSHLLADDTMKSPDEIQKKAEAYGVQADFTRMYQLFLLVPREIPDHFKSPEGRHGMEDFLSDLAEDVLKADLPETNYGWIYHRLWMSVPAEHQSMAMELMASLDALCQEMAGVRAVIYYDRGCYLEELGGRLRTLMELDKKNVSVQQGLYHPGVPEEAAGLEETFFQDVRSLLEARQYAALEAYIGEQSCRDIRMNPQSLYLASLRFSNEILRHLEQTGIKPEEIYSGEIVEKRESSLCNITDFFAQMALIARRLAQVCSVSDSEPEGVASAKQYIQNHICERIRREDIAASTHFSADYIARMFKASVGKSINEYIMEQKMVYACRLMEQTDLNVGDIAAEVGYSSFSYFTEIFKRFIGCLPSEYRQTRISGTAGQQSLDSGKIPG